MDYQLGGGSPPADGVGIVVRDGTDEPAAGVYSVCYLNGFQTQPGADWPDELVLHDASGAEVFDPGWPDERILDISTAARREGIAAQLEPAVAACRDDGFQAVEFDNLDSYTRSGDRLDLEDAVAFATRLVQRATAAGLEAGQKNTPQLGARGPEIGFTFAVTEECARYRECGEYTAVYGQRVIDIEYADDLDRTFEEICADPETPASTILRDRSLATPDDPGYVYEHC